MLKHEFMRVDQDQHLVFINAKAVKKKNHAYVAEHRYNVCPRHIYSHLLDLTRRHISKGYSVIYEHGSGPVLLIYNNGRPIAGNQ